MSANSVGAILVLKNPRSKGALATLLTLSVWGALHLSSCVENLSDPDICSNSVLVTDSLQVSQIELTGEVACNRDVIQDSLTPCQVRLLPQTSTLYSVLNSLDSSKIAIHIDSVPLDLRTSPWIQAFDACGTKIFGPYLNVPQTLGDSLMVLSWISATDTLQHTLKIQTSNRRPQIQIQSTDSTVSLQAKAHGLNQLLQYRLDWNTDIPKSTPSYAALDWKLSPKDLGSNFSCADTTKLLGSPILACLTQNQGNTTLELNHKMIQSSQEYCTALDSNAKATFYKQVRQSCESSAI
jgi:hypothetical protein